MLPHGQAKYRFKGPDISCLDFRLVGFIVDLEMDFTIWSRFDAVNCSQNEHFTDDVSTFVEKAVMWTNDNRLEICHTLKRNVHNQTTEISALNIAE